MEANLKPCHRNLESGIMSPLAKYLSLVLIVLAVPIAIMMIGIIVITVAFSNYGIRGGWGLSDVGLLVSGVMYPVLAVAAFKKVRSRAAAQAALAWSLMPVPVLLIIIVLLVKFSAHLR